MTPAATPPTSDDHRSIGKPVGRIEDGPLITGSGRYIDDIVFDGMLEAAFVRSPHPHALIRSIDAAQALALPGVHAVFTLADLRSVVTQDRLPLQFRTSALPPDITPFVLAKDEVSFVGEAIAIVVAESRYIAEDASALVEIGYEPLPAVSDARTGAQPGTPLAHRGRASNVMNEFRQSYGDVAAAFATAPHTLSISLKQHRGGAHSIEGRGVVAAPDRNDGKLTVWASTQMAHEIRAMLMHMLDRDENQIRVAAPEVGGGFGAKFCPYPEDVAVPAAALKLGRPVKWIEDRREHFCASIQERDQYWDLDVAFDGEGRLLGVRGALIHDQGAFTPQGVNLPYNASTNVPGPYLLPAYDLAVQVVETNKVAVAPVRGAGYPEGTFAMERALDRIAAHLGLDRAEVRLRNLVTPEQLPLTTPMKTRAGSAITLDTGDYPHSQKQALAAIGYKDFAARQQEARAQGLYRGIGFGNGIKGTGRGPFESGIVRVGRSGRISVYTGAMPMGQGIRTALAQIAAEQFGVAPASVTVVAGDTAVIPHGQGGFASRQTITAGSAVHLAAKAVREKALDVAAHMLEASPSDLDMRDGRIEIAGAPGSGVSLREVAEAVSGVPGYSLPGNFEPGLESLNNFIPGKLTYGMACHAAEVEVDAATGGVRILRYVVVNDSGRLINPQIVEGQIVGGVVHAIGNSLYEWMGYDDGAQPVTTTFAEYLLTTAPEIPPIDVMFLEYPAKSNPLGVKGVGEAGCVPAASAIVSAVENALAPFGIELTEYPIRPAPLRAMIEDAQNRSRSR